LNIFINVIPMIHGWGEKSTIVLLYLGPDSMLPLASILAAIVGFILIFWRHIFKIVKKFFRKIMRKPAELPADPPTDSATAVVEKDSEDQT
jgi:hypothetical protein